MLRAFSGLALTSLGIAAGSITLFANLLAPPDMADWAWSVVAPWQEATSEFWDGLVARLGLALPSSLVTPLNVAVALLFTAIGARVRDHQQQSVRVLSYPLTQLLGAMIAIFAIGYALLAGQSQPDGSGEVVNSAPLLIFLAAAAASFSPALAGRGNLTKRLWFLLAFLAILLGLNELTKVGLALTTPTSAN